MIKYFTAKGYPILIAHYPGQTRRVASEIMIATKDYPITIPDNIDVVTVATQDSIASSPLIYQLEKNNCKYINATPKLVPWHPTKKIKYMLDGLKQSNKEYVLLLDAADVTIMGDLSDIIKKFKTYNKKILYNASIWAFPQDMVVDHVENRGQYGDYSWLNAGCCIGERQALIDFYEEVWNDVKKEAHPLGSEQYYIRKHFDNHQDTIFFDYDCKIFQCWHKQEYKEQKVRKLDGSTEIRRRLLY